MLEAIRLAQVVTGPRFVEWGSGLGVTTLLAEQAGYAATGIELEAELVAGARSLADELGAECTFLQGDLFASSHEGEDGVPAEGDAGAWPVLDADLVYAYPWPAEAARLVRLFTRRHPKPGALLALYHGGARFEVLRWTG